MTQPELDRRALRDGLLARYPWLDATEVGPRTVEAGECDRCGGEARLTETCGPVAWQYLGRQCAAELGLEAWCDGHAEDAERSLAYLSELPAEADVAARLWWVSTGEVRLDPTIVVRQARVLRLTDGMP